MATSFVNLNKEQLIIENLSRSLDESRDALSNSSFNNFPNEIILHIFSFLSVRSLCNVSLVCRSFKMIADHDEIWKYKSNTSMKLPFKSYKQIYIEWKHEKALRNKKLLKALEGRFRTACIMRRPPSFTLRTYPIRSASGNQFEIIGGFHQHPNLKQDLTITLTVDIDKTTPALISLLKKASRFREQWQQSHILKQMIQRYDRFMQLKASSPPKTLLIPTMDIEIVWQTHLLRPEMYRDDCLRLFRRFIDHSLIMNSEIEKYFKEQAFIDTCQLYEQKFGEKYCLRSSIKQSKKTVSDSKKSEYAYWDESNFEFPTNLPKDYENPFSFTEADIILDLKWFDMCENFMSNALDKVANRFPFFHKPHDVVDIRLGPLKRLKKSYERFLYMAAKYPLKDGNGFIPPTYAIDIIWHSHMQEPLNYEADCLRLVGYVIYHDPWPVTEAEEMKKSCDQVDQIWKDEFKCDINTDHLYNTSDNRDPYFDSDTNHLSNTSDNKDSDSDENDWC